MTVLANLTWFNPLVNALLKIPVPLHMLLCQTVSSNYNY